MPGSQNSKSSLEDNDDYGYQMFDASNAYMSSFVFVLWLTISTFLRAKQKNMRITSRSIIFILAFIVSYFKAKMRSEPMVQIFQHSIIFFTPSYIIYATRNIGIDMFYIYWQEVMAFVMGIPLLTLAVGYSIPLTIGFYGSHDNRPIAQLLYLACLCSNERVPYMDHFLDTGRFPILSTIVKLEAVFWQLITINFANLGLPEVIAADPETASEFVVKWMSHQFLSVIVAIIASSVALWFLRMICHYPDYVTMLSVLMTFMVYGVTNAVGLAPSTATVVYTMIINSSPVVHATEMEKLLKTVSGVFYGITDCVMTIFVATFTAILFRDFRAADSYWPIAFNFILRIVLRVTIAFFLHFSLKSRGYEVTFRQLPILCCCILKGAVSSLMTIMYYLVTLQVSNDSHIASYMYLVADFLLCQIVGALLLPEIMNLFGALDMSETDRHTLEDALIYLQHESDLLSDHIRDDPEFLIADWRWVLRHTRIIESSQWKNRLLEDHEASEQASFFLQYRRTLRAFCLRTYHDLVVQSVLRFQQVSFSRQYRQGIIRRQTMNRLRASIQKPIDKNEFVNTETMARLIRIPKWVHWLKKQLTTFEVYQEISVENTTSLTPRFDKTFHDILMDMFEHDYYDVTVTSTTISSVLIQLALAFTALQQDSRITWVIFFESAYLLVFLLEVLFLTMAYGQRLVGMDNLHKFDVILLVACSLLFCAQCGFLINTYEIHVQHVLVFIFCFFMALRFIHAAKYIEAVLTFFYALAHDYLDRRIYLAYEMGMAFVVSEEEIQQNLRKSVENAVVAMEVRKRSAANRLFILRELVDIQSRYPGVVVAFQSRQASQFIMNETTNVVTQMNRSGIIEDQEWNHFLPALNRYHMRIVEALGSFRASYKPIAMLRVIPWIATDFDATKSDWRPDAIRQFLAIKIRPVQFAPGEVIVRHGDDHPIIMAYSGILKVEGFYKDSGLGIVPNSSSWLFFYNEGEFTDYIASPTFLGELGLISEQKSITQVTAETQINAYIIPRSRVMEAINIFVKPPSLLYQIWCHVARTIAIMTMQLQHKYMTWPIEKISNRLDNFILPDFERTAKFMLTQEVEDAILIQGTVLDSETQETYVAPVYLPVTVRRLRFLGTFGRRPRPVVLLIADRNYKLPPDQDWLRMVHQEGTGYLGVNRSKQAASKQP